MRRAVVSVNRHIRDEQRLFDPPRRRARVMQHLVQCYIRSVRITQNYHAHGVAHEDDVDATLIEQTRGGIIVRREGSDLLTAMLHLAKIFHCACSQDQLPISERKLSRKRRCSAGFTCLCLPALRKVNDCTRILKIREIITDSFLLARQKQVRPDIGQRPKHKGS